MNYSSITFSITISRICVPLFLFGFCRFFHIRLSSPLDSKFDSFLFWPCPFSAIAYLLIFSLNAKLTVWPSDLDSVCSDHFLQTSFSLARLRLHTHSVSHPALPSSQKFVFCRLSSFKLLHAFVRFVCALFCTCRLFQLSTAPKSRVTSSLTNSAAASADAIISSITTIIAFLFFSSIGRSSTFRFEVCLLSFDFFWRREVFPALFVDRVFPFLMISLILKFSSYQHKLCFVW